MNNAMTIVTAILSVAAGHVHRGMAGRASHRDQRQARYFSPTARPKDQTLTGNGELRQCQSKVAVGQRVVVQSRLSFGPC